MSWFDKNLTLRNSESNIPDNFGFEEDDLEMRQWSDESTEYDASIASTVNFCKKFVVPRKRFCTKRKRIVTENDEEREQMTLPVRSLNGHLSQSKKKEKIPLKNEHYFVILLSGNLRSLSTR